MNVYNLTGFFDTSGYEGFFSVDKGFLDVVPHARADKNWNVTRVGNDWKSKPVTGVISKANDFPCVNLSVPAFSKRAVECLEAELLPNGELLPIKAPAGEYWAFNVTRIADVLDAAASKVVWMKGKYGAIDVMQYAFQPKKLGPLSIFRIPEQASWVFVTQGFVDKVKRAALNGFNFQLVWPLPEGVNWKVLAKEAEGEPE